MEYIKEPGPVTVGSSLVRYTVPLSLETSGPGLKALAEVGKSVAYVSPVTYTVPEESSASPNAPSDPPLVEPDRYVE